MAIIYNVMTVETHPIFLRTAVGRRVALLSVVRPDVVQVLNLVAWLGKPRFVRPEVTFDQVYNTMQLSLSYSIVCLIKDKSVSINKLNKKSDGPVRGELGTIRLQKNIIKEEWWLLKRIETCVSFVLAYMCVLRKKVLGKVLALTASLVGA